MPLPFPANQYSMLASLGKDPHGNEKQLTHQSPNYRDGQFQNPVPTRTMSESGWKMLKIILQFISKPSYCVPPKPLPALETDLLNLPDEKPVIVWFGHSSYLIKIDGKIILVDPVFSGHVGPFKNMNKAFAGTDIYHVEDMPDIDVLVITHDHYDHLDYETVIKLKPKVRAVCTSLGVASHLVYWGYEESLIHELDWYQSSSFDNLTFTALPARHFSGRSLHRDQTLWSAFVLQTSSHKLFLGGDSGYASHFAEIGEEYGPFDIALLECGQYNLAWHDIHMLPEETAQAAINLKAKALMPVHWAKFSISLHPWNEPIQRITKAVEEKSVKLVTPMIGEPVVIDENYPDKRWWEEAADNNSRLMDVSAARASAGIGIILFVIFSATVIAKAGSGIYLATCLLPGISYGLLLSSTLNKQIVAWKKITFIAVSTVLYILLFFQLNILDDKDHFKSIRLIILSAIGFVILKLCFDTLFFKKVSLRFSFFMPVILGALSALLSAFCVWLMFGKQSGDETQVNNEFAGLLLFSGVFSIFPLWQYCFGLAIDQTEKSLINSSYLFA